MAQTLDDMLNQLPADRRKRIAKRASALIEEELRLRKAVKSMRP